MIITNILVEFNMHQVGTTRVQIEQYLLDKCALFTDKDGNQ